MKKLCLKTYIVQFIYGEGNGWAFINARSVNQAEQVFRVQTRYKDAKITGIKETKYYGEEMQLVYEGAVTTGNKTLYDLAVLNGFKGSLDEFLKSLVGPKGDKGDKGNKGDKGDKGDPGKDAPVEDLWNAINDKQDTLVSGINIKTVNNESLLGGGNMDTKPPVVLTAVMTANGYQVQDYSVDGFSSAWERGCICSLRLSGGHYDGFELMCIGFYLENGDKIFSFSCWTGLSLVVADLFADGSVSDGTLNMNSKQDVSPITNAASGALVVNEYRDFGTVSALTVTLSGGTMTNYDLYKFAFTCASDSTTLTLPSGIKLPVDMEMEMAAGRRFECVIDYASCLTFNCWD